MNAVKASKRGTVSVPVENIPGGERPDAVVLATVQTQL